MGAVRPLSQGANARGRTNGCSFGKDHHADAQKGSKHGRVEQGKSRRAQARYRACRAPDDGRAMKVRRRGPALTKAALRAQGNSAMAAATKPIVKLPTKLVRQCGRCGEFASVMVEPGQAPPEFKCKSCGTPTQRG
jgi:hypothetical protein